MGVQRRKLWRVRRRLGRELLTKHVVRPLAQGGDRPEVRGERQHLARTWVGQPITNNVINVDVRATETVDRLFGIADDEEGAWTKRDRAPVDRFGQGPAEAGHYRRRIHGRPEGVRYGCRGRGGGGCPLRGG